MANEVFAIDGSPTGTQKLGSTVIKTGKTYGLVYQVNDDRIKTIDISSITDKWDDRFDEPRYYTSGS